MFPGEVRNFSEYFEWDQTDKLFQLRVSRVGAAGQILWDTGKQSTVGRIVALLKARFGSENQAERFRAELRSRKRTKGETLQKLYQDVRRLMSLAYPGESSFLSDIVGRDAFLEALEDQALRVRIPERELKNVDDALNMASRLEAFDIMGSTGQEAEKSKSRFARNAAGGKESTGSGGTKMSEEILRQLADLIVLMNSFRRHLDRQQQEITTLKMSHKPPYSGKWNLSHASHAAGAPWPGKSSSFPEFAQDQRVSAGLGRGPVRIGGGHRVHGGSRAGDICRNCGERGHWVRECRAAEEHGNTPEASRAMGGSINIFTDRRHEVDVYLASD